MDNGDYATSIPLVGGDMTVSRSGDSYTITLNFEDGSDTPHTIGGEYVGTPEFVNMLEY
jgi:hypothetical protein